MNCTHRRRLAFTLHLFAGIASPLAARGQTPPEGVLLGSDPRMQEPDQPPQFALFEPSIAVMPSCANVIWSSGNVSDRIYAAPLDFTAMFQSDPPNLPNISGGGQVQPGAYKDAAAELPPDVIYAGGTLGNFLGQPVCENDGQPVPKFLLVGQIYVNGPGGVVISGGAGFEDTQTVRIGDTSVLNTFAVGEWFADPNSALGPCQPSPSPSGAPPGRKFWPWVRRSSSCGFGWDVNTAVVFSNDYDGDDGNSLYADPFDFGPGNPPGTDYRTIYRTGRSTCCGQQMLRSDNGGLNWAPVAVHASWWHPRITSTAPHQVVGVGTHGTLFYGNCESGSMAVYWSYDRGFTFKGPLLLPTPCAPDSYQPTKAMSRVATFSEAFDAVRVAYPTKIDGGPARVAVGLVVVPSAPGIAAPPQVVSSGGPTTFGAVDSASSVERLQFIDPDTFDWFKNHDPGAPLPDTAVLAWEENGDPPVSWTFRVA